MTAGSSPAGRILFKTSLINYQQQLVTINKNLEKLSSNWIFLKQSLKEFRTNGAILPSSKFLSEQILKPLKMKDGVVIVELGAGTGAFTKEIIYRLPKNGILLVIEINNKLTEHLQKTISDKRVMIVEDDASNLSKHLEKFNLKKPDYIISGIPLGNLSWETRQKLFSEINNCLSDDGLFIQFQYFLASWFHIKKFFNAKIASYELRNLPPAFLYHCRKKKL